jgi:hypothetical protein
MWAAQRLRRTVNLIDGTLPSRMRIGFTSAGAAAGATNPTKPQRSCRTVDLLRACCAEYAATADDVAHNLRQILVEAGLKVDIVQELFGDVHRVSRPALADLGDDAP